MNKTHGQIAYEAYCGKTDWKSLVSGQPLPTWEQVKPEIKEAWEAAAAAVAPRPTPDASLPPFGDGPRRKMLVTIEVAADFEKRLDNQWMVEREIHADRWSWQWAEESPKTVKAPAWCPKCLVQYDSPTTGQLLSKCAHCGGELTELPD